MHNRHFKLSEIWNIKRNKLSSNFHYSCFCSSPHANVFLFCLSCPLVSVLCSGIQETNATVSHLVTHTSHTLSRTHLYFLRLNARVSAGLSKRVSSWRHLLVRQDTHTETHKHTRTVTEITRKHAETHGQTQQEGKLTICKQVAHHGLLTPTQWKHNYSCSQSSTRTNTKQQHGLSQV